MAQVVRTAQFPNLLWLHGGDVAAPNAGDPHFHLLRPGVKATLFNNNNGVGNFRGKVDFIICYVVDGTGGDHAGVDHAPAKEDPPQRPLRGIIQLPDDLRAPFNTARLAGHMGGSIGHEVGHYWLVPGRARVRIGGEEVDTPTPDEIAQSLNNGRGLPRVPFMGRQDSHWSPYIHTEGSFMDGIDHAFDPLNPWLERWYGFGLSTGESGTGVTIDFEGSELTTTGKFNDFELFLMGLFPRTGNPHTRKLQVLEPRWVYPVPFHAGLYAEFANGQKWYCGFLNGPDRIRALSTLGQSQEPTTWLSSPFDPYNRVVFRIVQRGGEAELQARVHKPQRIDPAAGCLYSVLVALGAKVFRKLGLPPDLTCDDVGTDPGFAPAENRDVYTGWRRLARVASRATRVGLAARHTEKPCFARLKPKVLCLWTNGTPTPVPPLATENASAFADPSWGSTVLGDGSLVLPYRVGHDTGALLLHDAQVDNAPRRVMDAPPADFVFGGELELSECTLVSWAGGSAVGKTFAGSRREVAYSDVNYLANWDQDYVPIRQAEPSGGHYRMLFCLVSNGQLTNADRDTQLANLDRVRRAWEVSFEAMLSGRRLADTVIHFP